MKYAVTAYDSQRLKSRDVRRFETIKEASEYAAKHSSKYTYGLLVDYADTPSGRAALEAARAA